MKTFSVLHQHNLGFGEIDNITHTVGFTNFLNTCFIAICRDIQRRKQARCDGSYCCVEALQRLKTAC